MRDNERVESLGEFAVKQKILSIAKNLLEEKQKPHQKAQHFI
jgi:hypothetical protein